MSLDSFLDIDPNEEMHRILAAYDGNPFAGSNIDFEVMSGLGYFCYAHVPKTGEEAALLTAPASSHAPSPLEVQEVQDS